MNFKEGILRACKTRRSDGEITDSFYLYCRLSDLCASTFEDKKKVSLLYAVDKRLCIFETLLSEGQEGGKELKEMYAVAADLLSEDKYQKLIDCAVWARQEK